MNEAAPGAVCNAERLPQRSAGASESTATALPRQGVGALGGAPQAPRGGRLQHAIRIAAASLSVCFYMLMAPAGYAAFFLFALLPSRKPERRARTLQAIVRRAFAGMHHWLRWVRVVDFDPRALPPLPAGPCVLIANHPTLTDTTAILGAVPEVCTAVRADLYRKYWLRPLLGGAGHFDAGNGSLLGVQTLIEQAQGRLQSGFRVLVFPEGRRSPRGGLRPFGRAAFEISCRARVPVVALKIREDPPWLASGDSLFGPPASLPVKQLDVLAILAPEDFSEDSRAMREYVEALYREALELAGPRPERPRPAEPGPRGPAPTQLRNS